MAQEPDEVTRDLARDVNGVTAAGSTGGTPEQIRSQIEETRREMSATIDGIQDRLRPANLLGRANDRVRSATSRRVRDLAEKASHTASDVARQTTATRVKLVAMARHEPMPFALLAFGAALLLVGALTRRPRTVTDDRYRL